MRDSAAWGIIRGTSADRAEFANSCADDQTAKTRSCAQPGSISVVPLLGAVAHRLDLVAVGIAQEGGVIGGVIGAQAGWAVIDAAGGDAGAPERVDLGSRPCLEAPVAAGGFVRPRAAADGEVDAVRILRVGAFAVAEPAVAAAALTTSSASMTAS